MTNMERYPTILSPEVGILLSLIVNFVLPSVAILVSRRLKRYRWWPHLLVCIWQIASPIAFGFLLLPDIPIDEAPGPGDGFVLIPTILSAAVVLLGYFIVLAWKLCWAVVVMLYEFYTLSRRGS